MASTGAVNGGLGLGHHDVVFFFIVWRQFRKLSLKLSVFREYSDIPVKNEQNQECSNVDEEPNITALSMATRKVVFHESTNVW